MKILAKKSWLCPWQKNIFSFAFVKNRLSKMIALIFQRSETSVCCRIIVWELILQFTEWTYETFEVLNICVLCSD